MSAAAVVAIVFVVIFIIGITVGYIVVIALSAIRADRKAVREATGESRVAGRPKFPGILNDPAALDEPDDEETGRNSGVSGIPGHWDSVPSDDRPRWPGDADSGYQA
jgi:hypothetical protein